jgi:hypothetical protein
MTNDATECSLLGLAQAISKNLAERTTQLRKLAAKADYSLTGVVCSDDPFPYHIDELCERLQKVGDTKALGVGWAFWWVFR